MKKRIFSIIFTFIFAVTYMLPTSASAYDATVRLHKRNLNGVDRQSNVSNSLFKTVDTSYGTVAAYCLNAGKDAPSDGAILSVANDITTGPLLFILNHGYHTDGTYDAGIMGNLDGDTAYYATSLAVWLYEGAYAPSYIDTSKKGGAAAVALFNAAQGQSTLPAGDVWSAMAATTYEMSLSSDGNYYTTVEMWLVGNNAYFQSAPVYIESSSSDYILRRADGSTFSSGTTLNYGEHWTLSIPANKVSGEMTFTIKWGFNYPVAKVYRYVSSEANKQEIGILTTEYASHSEQAVLHLTPKVRVTCESELADLLKAYPKDKRTESNTEYMNKLKDLASRYSGFDMEDIDEPSCTPVPRTCQTKLTKLLNKTPENLRVSTNTTYMTALNKLKAEYPEFDMDDLANPSCTPVACETKLAKLLAKTPESKRVSSNTEYVNALKVLASKYSTFDMDDLKNPSCTKVQRMCEDKLRILLEKTPESKRTESNTEYMNALKALKNEYPDFDMFDIKKPSCTPVSRTCQEELDKLLSKYSEIERNEKNADYIKELNELKTKYKEMDITNIAEPSCTPRVPEKILKVRKIDAATKGDLAGATLQIQKEDGTPVKQWISDGTPAVFTDIEPGTYVLVELSAPEGYVGDGVIKFTLNGDDYSVEIVMENSKIPDTADMNFTLIMTAFIIFLGFGIFGLIKAGRREA